MIMDKMDGNGLEIIEVNIKRLADSFPECARDGKIDFDILKKLIGEEVIASDDSYKFVWTGKNTSIKQAIAPSTNTLLPIPELSKNWDSTKNIYIEGDNLEVLKVISKTYHCKIKMIYIDPPYNTGHDFIYNDNFVSSSSDYLTESNQTLKTNPNSSGRFHTNWLNMMYPRLKIARDLLREDGAIFISIDDNELQNLLKICDEIFGENNRIGLITLLSNPRGSQNSDHLSYVHEYVVIYAKDEDEVDISGISKSDDIVDEYNQEDEKGKYRLLGLRKRGGAWRKEDRPLMHYPIYVNPQNGKCSLTRTSEFSVEVIPARPTGELGRWCWGKAKFELEKDKLIGKPINRNGSDDAWDIFRKDYLTSENGEEKTSKVKTIWEEKETNYQNAKNEIKALFGDSEIFDFPKPTYIVKKLASMITNGDNEDIVLDFFSGSATTADAVMQLNALDSTNRRFILVQIPETTKEKSQAFKHGFKTICEVGEERIRRAGDKIVADLEAEKEKIDLFSETKDPSSCDIGFKVFRLDSTSIIPWDGSKQYDESNLLNLNDVFKEGRTKLDVAYEVMLKYGVFDKQLEEKKINGKDVFCVDNDSLVIFLEDEINMDDVKEIIKLNPTTVVFKESGFADDNVKMNAEYTLRHYLGEDQIKVLCI